MTNNVPAILYLVASVCFIMSLRGLSSPETARSGNLYGMVGMAIAILTTLAAPTVVGYVTILAGLVIGGAIGTVVAQRIEMTALPQLVAAFHSLVGLAAVLIAAGAFYAPAAYGIGAPGQIEGGSLFEMGLGTAIGAITFTGSLVAFAKLQGLVGGKPLVFPGQHWLNLVLAILIFVVIGLFMHSESGGMFWLLVLISMALGFLLILPIGGADMPVVVSMLNSYSGWAASGIGFTLHNSLLIVTGALVGSSGAILSYIMCKGMNRSIFNVILGGFGTEGGVVAAAGAGGDRAVKSGSAEDAAFIMKNASSVIVVPGYGMAVAQAQHALREMTDLLKEAGVTVRFAIHPVAGRMPGHMNVLLAEANVSYDDVVELEDINRDFASTDVAFVIGANDVTNPAAKTDPQSPIYGMPILDVDRARTVLFIKRSMASGYAGVENDLFELLRLLLQRHLQVGFVEETRVGQPRGEHLAVALDDLGAAVARVDVGDAHEGVGELARTVAAHEILLVHARGELDHLGRHVEEGGVEAAEQRHRPFGQPGVLRHQPLVLHEAEPGLGGQRGGARADQAGALVRVDDDVAGAQLLDVVRRRPDRDRAGMVEAVADGSRAALDADDRARHHALAEQRDDAVQRADPAQALGGLRRRAPAHRLGPGKGADDSRDRLGEHVGGGTAGTLDHREPGAVALGQLVLRQPGLAQEAFQRLRGRGNARSLGLFRDGGRPDRQPARDQRKPAWRGVGDGLGGGEARLGELGREQPGEVLARLRLHARRDLLRAEFEQEVGRGVGHADHPCLSIHAAHAPFARSRTRPI